MCERIADLCRRIVDNISRVVVGKKSAIEMLLVALLAEGHLLIEDVPGLGKTLIAKSLAGSLNAGFKRVQCTPDLLPADITGFSVYNQQSGRFQLRYGPVMTHVLLVDEINRAIPRTQFGGATPVRCSCSAGCRRGERAPDCRAVPMRRPWSMERGWVLASRASPVISCCWWIW